MKVVGDAQGPASGPDIVAQGPGLDGPGNAVGATQHAQLQRMPHHSRCGVHVYCVEHPAESFPS